MSEYILSRIIYVVLRFRNMNSSINAGEISSSQMNNLCPSSRRTSSDSQREHSWRCLTQMVAKRRAEENSVIDNGHQAQNHTRYFILVSIISFSKMCKCVPFSLLLGSIKHLKWYILYRKASVDTKITVPFRIVISNYYYSAEWKRTKYGHVHIFHVMQCSFWITNILKKSQY
jgi:hypothetical protein